MWLSSKSANKWKPEKKVKAIGAQMNVLAKHIREIEA